MRTCGEESSTKKKQHTWTVNVLTWRHIAWMIHEHFKICDTDSGVLDISDFLKIELRRDSVQTFDTKWDETSHLMQKQPDEQEIKIVYLTQLQTSDQLKHVVALYIQGTVWKSEPKSNKTRTIMWLDIWNFSSRDRRGEETQPCCSCSPRKGTGERRKDIASNGSRMVHAPEDKLVVSSVIWQRKAKEATQDKEANDPRDANPAARMVSKQEPAPQERLTKLPCFWFAQGKVWQREDMSWMASSWMHLPWERHKKHRQKVCVPSFRQGHSRRP